MNPEQDILPPLRRRYADLISSHSQHGLTKPQPSLDISNLQAKDLPQPPLRAAPKNPLRKLHARQCYPGVQPSHHRSRSTNQELVQKIEEGAWEIVGDVEYVKNAWKEELFQISVVELKKGEDCVKYAIVCVNQMRKGWRR